MAENASERVNARRRSVSDDPRVIQAKLDVLEDHVAAYGRLDLEEAELVRQVSIAQAKLDSVKSSNQPGIDQLNLLSGTPSAQRKQEINKLQSPISSALSELHALNEQLRDLVSRKAALQSDHDHFDSRKARLERDLNRAREVVSGNQSALVGEVIPGAPTPIRVEASAASSLWDEQLKARQVPLNVVNVMTPEDKDYAGRKGFVWDDFSEDPVLSKYRPHSSTGSGNSTPVHPIAAATSQTSTSVRESRGFWPFVIALIVIAALLFSAFVWPNWWPYSASAPQTHQPRATTSQPANPSVASIWNTTEAPPDGIEDYGINSTTNRVIVHSSVPTTAKLTYDGKVVAEDASFSLRHNLDWKVPVFTTQSQDFTVTVSLTPKDGTTESKGHTVHVMLESVSAGGVHTPDQILGFLQATDSGIRAEYVRQIKLAAPGFPGVSTLTADNLVDWVRSNLSHFKVEKLQSNFVGSNFAYVAGDGSLHYSPQTLLAGTEVVTFDGKLLAAAVCGNLVKTPVPSPPTTPTLVPTPTPTSRPTPTPTPTATPTPTNTPVPTPSPTKDPGNGPSPPPPPPPNPTPVPTYPPPTPAGNITGLSFGSCGPGCMALSWNQVGSHSGLVYWGIHGYSLTSQAGPFVADAYGHIAGSFRCTAGTPLDVNVTTDIGGVANSNQNNPPVCPSS